MKALLSLQNLVHPLCFFTLLTLSPFFFPPFLQKISFFLSSAFLFFFSVFLPLPSSFPRVLAPPLPYAPLSSLSHSKPHLLFIFSSLKTWGKWGIMVVWGTLCPPLCPPLFFLLYIFLFFFNILFNFKLKKTIKINKIIIK